MTLYQSDSRRQRRFRRALATACLAAFVTGVAGTVLLIRRAWS